MDYAVIMAGGSGTRLWPLSRAGEPKQLLTIFDGRSLLQLAWERLRHLLPAERILVCTSAHYADLVRAQLPDLDENNLLGEPVGRDSLNAVAWSSAVVADRDPEAVVAVVTADQLIEPVEAFVDALREGYALAAADPRALVCFGVVPTSPHTGYGYLERGEDIPGYAHASQIRTFHEKPDAPTAEAYLASGGFWWNAGMFVWRAATFMDQLDQLMPATARGVRQIVADPDRLGEVFPRLTKISVDYAIMEPVSAGATDAHVAAVGMAITWADVGSYASLAQVVGQEPALGEGRNAVIGRVTAMDTDGCLLVNATERTVACVDVEGLAIIATDEAVMVAPLSSSQKVKALAEAVSERSRAVSQ